MLGERDTDIGMLACSLLEADQANQEATAAIAAAMTVASEVNKTPAPWTFHSNRTAAAATAAKGADKAAADKASADKTEKAAKADKAVMSHLLQLDPTALEAWARRIRSPRLLAPGGPAWPLAGLHGSSLTQETYSRASPRSEQSSDS